LKLAFIFGNPQWRIFVPDVAVSYIVAIKAEVDRKVSALPGEFSPITA
jgi:hypothetical protein